MLFNVSKCKVMHVEAVFHERSKAGSSYSGRRFGNGNF